jgi:hypothetical protein
MFRIDKNRLTAPKNVTVTDAKHVGPEEAPAPAVETVRATYAVDDFVSLDDAALAELVGRAHADADRGLPSCAHLAITRDLRSGVVNHYVPCASAIEAFALASQIVAEKRTEDPEREFTVTITPLLPH